MDENDRENLQTEPPEKAAPEPKEFKLDVSDLDDKIARGVERAVSTIFDRQATRNQPANPDFESQSIDENDDADSVVQKRVHNALIPLRREMEQFKGFGLSKLAELTETQAAGELPYFNKYKTEIRAELSKFDPGIRANRETVKLVHDTVVNRHIEDIIGERLEEKARRDLQDAQPPKPGINSRSAGAPDNDPNRISAPAEIFDEDQVQMIEERGGPDKFAQSISNGRFATWSDYMKSRQGMAARPKREGRPTIPFRRLEEKRHARSGVQEKK